MRLDFVVEVVLRRVRLKECKIAATILEQRREDYSSLECEPWALKSRLQMRRANGFPTCLDFWKVHKMKQPHHPFPCFLE